MEQRFSGATPQHLDTAFRHAEILQRQKTVDRQNFDALEKLLDCPWSEDANVQEPAMSDMLEVNRLLQLFRPVDFDELVDERHLACMCGYVLCPTPRPRNDSKVHAKMHSPSGHVRAKMQKAKTSPLAGPWCSHECLRRAAYLRAQLNEEPGWLRILSSVSFFQFPVGQIDMSQSLTLIQSTTIGAANEGDQSADLSPPIAAPLLYENLDLSDTQQLIAEHVVERNLTESRMLKSDHDGHPAHNAIEGYII